MTLAVPMKLDVISFATVATPGTPVATFASIHNASLNANSESLVETPAGHPAPLFGAVHKVKPDVSFSTPQLDTLLANLTTWGAGISAKLYQKKSSGVAPYARSGTVHNRYDISQAVACWERITLPATGIADADVKIYSIYDGTHSPFISNGSVILPAGVLSLTNYFAAGPVYLNKVLLDGVQSIEIQSGVKFRSDGDSSSIYDTYGELTIDKTIVTIKTKNQVNWSSVLLSGLGLTDFTFFAKAWANSASGSFIANGMASHILFFNATSLAEPVNSTAQGQELWSDTLRVTCFAPDDTHAPLSATMSSAIAAPV